MTLSCPRYAVAAAALLAATPAQDRTRVTPLVYPDDTIVAIGDQRWLTCRLVDDISGQPLADAELFLVPEHDQPLPATFWSLRSAASDADGFVRVRLDDLAAKWSWVIVRAPGHAPVANMSAPDDLVWRLPRGVDVPVQVLDWAGRPVAGAELGFCRGCGHTPDLANATTGPDGIGVLRGIDTHGGISDVYVRHPHCGIGYDGIDWRPGEPPVLLRPGVGEAIEGVLLDDQGRPLAGVAVGTRDIHRGPWTLTGADGTFRLLGGSIGSPIVAIQREREVLFEVPGACPATWRLPVPDGEPSQHGTVAPPPAARTLPPPVAIRVRVDSGQTDDELDVDVATPHAAPQNPYGELSRDGALRVVNVPATGPFALVLGPGNGQSRCFPFADRARLPQEPVPLAWFPRTHVVGRIRDAAGEPLAAQVRLLGWDEAADGADVPLVDCPDGRVDLATEATGAHVLEVVPGRAGLRPRHLALVLPHRGDAARVDLGDIACRADWTLRVLDADGGPMAGSAGLVRANMQDPGSRVSFPLGADGGWPGPDPRAGDAVVVPGARDDDVPLRTVLEGPGPWTIRVPDTALHVAVEDEGGQPLDAVLFVGDEWRQVAGARTLRGLRPGPQRLFVTAAGRQTAIADITVPADGRVDLRVALPRR